MYLFLDAVSFLAAEPSQLVGEVTNAQIAAFSEGLLDACVCAVVWRSVVKIKNRKILAATPSSERFVAVAQVVAYVQTAFLAVFAVEVVFAFNSFESSRLEGLVLSKFVGAAFFLLRFLNDRAVDRKRGFAWSLCGSSAFFALLLAKGLALLIEASPMFVAFKVNTCLEPDTAATVFHALLQAPTLLLSVLVLVSLKWQHV